MDITPSGVLPRALQAQLGLPPPPAGVVPPPWQAGALEALVIAARPVATPSGGWNLEIDIGGERVQMSSATLLAAGTRLLLRALSPQRVRVEQVLSEPAQLQPLRNALRSDLPAQLPLREAIGGLATLAADPALPEPLRARIGQLLAQLPDPAQLQLAAGLRAAVLNSGSFLEPRLRELLTAATAAAPPAVAARTTSVAATSPPATDTSAASYATGAAVAAPASGPRAALAALLRLLLPARPGSTPANAPVAAGPVTASPPSAATAAVAVPLYDAQGALQRRPDAVPGAAAPAPGIPAATVPLAPEQASLAAAAGAMPNATNRAGAATAPLAAPGLPPAAATRATEGAAPGLQPAPGTASAPPVALSSAAPSAVTVVPSTGAAAVATQPTLPDASPGRGATPAAVPPPSAAGASDAPLPRLPPAPPATTGLPAAGADTPARGAAPAGVAADLKAQLFVLLEAASGWLRARPDASRTQSPGGGPGAPSLPLYTARGLFPGDTAPTETPAVTLPAAEQMAARLAQQLPGAEPSRPRDPEDLVETLLRYVVGALARTRVHQLGVHPESRRQSDSGALQAWSVEIPIAHGGRMDALEMQVEEHGRREGPRGGAERVWQVLMRLELEQIGPLHALLRLSGTRLATTLWVENPGALASARDTLAELGDLLRAEGVDVTRLECLPGAPPPRARGHDNLLDVST